MGLRVGATDIMGALVGLKEGREVGLLGLKEGPPDGLVVVDSTVG